jgi:hypothetical protein
VVGIDSDVILIEMRYGRDARHAVNAQFLRAVRVATPALTIYTLMEVLGQLSFNLPPAKLARWQTWLIEQYRLAVLWPNPGTLGTQGFMFQEIYERPLARMQAHRMGFADALAIELAERALDVHAFVTWNARHFANKTRLPVLTPAQYLDENGIHPETRSVIR